MLLINVVPVIATLPPNQASPVTPAPPCTCNAPLLALVANVDVEITKPVGVILTISAMFCKLNKMLLVNAMLTSPAAAAGLKLPALPFTPIRKSEVAPVAVLEISIATYCAALFDIITCSRLPPCTRKLPRRSNLAKGVPVWPRVMLPEPSINPRNANDEPLLV